MHNVADVNYHSLPNNLILFILNASFQLRMVIADDTTLVRTEFDRYQEPFNGKTNNNIIIARCNQ